MEHALPMVLGAILGLVGGAPYLWAFWWARRKRDASIVPGVAAVGISFLLLMCAILACVLLAREELLYYTVALVMGLMVIVAVGAMAFLVRSPR